MSAQLEQLRAKRDELKGLVTQATKELPWLSFEPNDAQRDFMQILDEAIRGDCRQVGAFFSNRCGKTVLLVNLAWNIAMGDQAAPFFAKYPWVRKWPFACKRFRLLCNSDQLKEFRGAIWNAMHDWWTPALYTFEKQGMDYPYVYHLPNGFIMDVATYDQPADRHESVELSLVLMDEPPPREVYQAYAWRLSKGGMRVIFATMLYEGEWIEPEFLQNPLCKYMFADIHRNCKQCAKVGYLEHDEIERMLAASTADPLELEARKTGRPLQAGRRVFSVHPTVHFKPREDCPKPADKGEGILVLDPHQQKPWAITIGKRDLKGRTWIVDEWPREPFLAFQGVLPMTVTDYARLLQDFIDRWHVNTSNCIIDYKFAKQTIRGKYDVTDLLQMLSLEFDLDFVAGNPNLIGTSGSIDLLRSMLKFDPTKPLDFLNSPQFFISDDLHNTTTHLRNLCWQKDKAEVLDTKYLDFARNCLYIAAHVVEDTPEMVHADPEKRGNARLIAAMEKNGEMPMGGFSVDSALQP